MGVQYSEQAKSFIFGGNVEGLLASCQAPNLVNDGLSPDWDSAEE